MAGDASGCQGESMMDKVALECGGDISASQEDLLARSSFLGGGCAKDVGDEEELFSTPALTQDPITMCTLPFTQSQSPPPPKSPAPRTTPAPPLDGDDDDDMAAFKQRRKPRVCTRKVRGARIRTPTPSPKQRQQQQQQLHLDDPDPLYKAVLMIPTTTTTTSQIPVEDFLALARQRGLF